MGKQIVTRIKEEIQKMLKSKDPTYTKTYIPWDSNRGFSVECIRADDDCNVYDENGKIMCDANGEPIGIEIYYQENGNDVDSCSLQAFINEEIITSIKEFVRMYR